MFNFINLYVAIHEISIFISKVAVLMHEHVPSCLHLSIEYKMLFDILCLVVLHNYIVQTQMSKLSNKSDMLLISLPIHTSWQAIYDIQSCLRNKE